MTVNANCCYSHRHHEIIDLRVKPLMRRFVLLMLLAWLPIQASAMPWFAFTCEQHEFGIHDQSAEHTGHAHHANGADQISSGDGDLDSANAGHTCCHHFSGVVHSMSISSGVTVAAGIAPQPPAPLYDFIPDLPKRPPLAHLV
jgi:hypothetical protein